MTDEYEIQIQQQKPVLYKSFRYHADESTAFWYIEVSDFACVYNYNRWELPGVPVTDYAKILNSTRGHDIVYFPIPVYYMSEVHTVVSRGGLSLACMANTGNKSAIKILVEAGALPDEAFTKFRYGESSGVWEYLQEVYKEFHGRKMAKPACITPSHN
jgi:hypothetical protein